MIHFSPLHRISKTFLFVFFCFITTLSQAQIGANWRLRNPKPWADSLTSVVALSTTRVIAVGRGTGLLISQDAGVTWSATRVDFNAEFGTDVYVAGGSARQILVTGNRVFTATNGENWSEASTNLASNDSLSVVVTRGTGWAAIKQTMDGTTGHSTYALVTAPSAGDTWTVVDTLPLVTTDDNTISAMILDGATYIVAGSHGNASMTHSEPILMSSFGGVGWTTTTLNGASDSWAIYSLATSGSVIIAASDDNIYRSTDTGATWTRHAVNSIPRVAWNGSRFVGAGYASRYSTDGITWTDATTPHGALTPLAISKVSTSIVAVGTGGVIYTTPNGEVWTQRAPTGVSDDLGRIAVNPAGVRVAFATFGVLAFRSTDGDTWSAQSANARDGVWFGSQFVAVNNTENCLTSPDGITWSDNFIFNSNSMRAIATDGTTVVAVGDDFAGVAKIFSSTNPSAGWTAATVPATVGTLLSVAKCGSLWVAVGAANTILTSTNAVTWTKRTAPGTYLDLGAVASNPTGTVFVAMGGQYSYGEYYTSTNGTNWTRRRLPTDLDITGAIWTGTNFLLSTNLNIVFASSDGINWSSRLLPTGNNILGMGWDATNKEAFLLGSAGTILSSDLVPEATFVTTTQSVFEPDITAAVQVNLTVPSTTALTIPFTISGTAVDGTDYTSFATSSVTFAAGETSKAIDVTLINDSLSESNKTIIFTLGTTAGMRVGNIGKHTMTILDDDGPPVVQFIGSAMSVPETVGTVGVQVTLARPCSAAVTIPLTTTGNAVASASGSSVTIPAGSATAFFSIPITPDTALTTDETCTLSLGTPNVGTVGSNSFFTLTVVDEDPASSTGQRWTLRQQQPSADALWALTTIPGATPRVIAVGDGGAIVTSDDHGATWTKRFSPLQPDKQYIGLHWNGSFAFAAGTGGHIGISPDGIAWSDIVVPGAKTNTVFNSLASNSTRTVAVGSEFPAGDVLPVIYSTQDAVHWSRVALPAGLRGGLRSVIYVNGTTPEFIAVGSDYNFETKTATTLILTSPNGLTWTNRSAALSGVDLTSIVAAGSTLVAFDGSKSAYSGVIAPADGSIAWTKRTLGTIGGLNYGAWNGSKLVGVGDATGTSTNGIAWVQKASPSKNRFNDITWTGSKFIAVAYPNGIYTSVDGVAWTPPTTPETDLPLFAVAWSGTQFCAVGGDFERVKTALIYTSPDGVAWTQRASTLKVPLLGITWSGTQFCAVGANGTIATSTNGIAWTIRTSGTTLDLHDVTWGVNQFVAVGGNETEENFANQVGGSILLTSKDGIAWTRRPIPTGKPLEGVVFNSNSLLSTGPIPTFGPMFVAVGRSTYDGGQGEAVVLTSPDAVTWTPRSSGVTGTDFQRISRTPTGYAATTGNFGVYASNDGSTWFPATAPVAPATSDVNALHGITLAGSRVIAVGGSGSIVSSLDGYSWTTQASQMRSGELFGVAASPTTVVAVGANASIQTSVVATVAPVPTVNFAQGFSSVNESAGTTTLLVTLSSPPSVPTSVVFHPTAGTGLVLTGAGADVTVPASPLVFNPGETAKYLTITVKPDNTEEANEALTLTLDSVNGGAAIGSQATHTLTIVNDDVAPVAMGSPSGITLVDNTAVLGANLMAGTPPMTFLWKKDGGAVPASAIGSTTGALYFKAVTLADGGAYTCTISNPAGSTTVTVRLGVVRNSGAAIPYAGTTTATLTQPASSNIVCHWFKDGSTTEVAAGPDFVFNANKSTLTVKNLAANTGSYACKVELPTVSMPPFGPGYTYNVTTTTAAPTIASTAVLPAGVIGTLYQFTMALTGLSSPVNTWSSPDLASVGLSIDPLTGVISGIPTAVVTNKVVTIVATNGKGSTTVKPTISITSPIAAFVGTHTGLMDRDPTVNNNLGGIVTVLVNANGTCTGSYTVGTVKTSFTGSVIATGPNSFNIRTLLGGTLQPPYGKVANTLGTFIFDYDSARTGQTGTGNIQLFSPWTNSFAVANLRTWRAITGAANLAPYIGRWNYALRLASPGNIGAPNLPQGHSFGSATIPASGVVSHAVKLSDGTSATAAAPVNSDGSSVLYSLLYGGKGSLMAAPQIANPALVDSTITDMSVSWNKPVDTTPAGARNYPQGWAPITLKLEGAKYKYVVGNSVMDLVLATNYPYSNASLFFAEGGTQATFPTPDVYLNIKDDGTLDGVIYNMFINANGRNATFKITPGTGAIAGLLDMNEQLANGTKITKRGSIAYSAQIVRIYNSGTSTFETMGLGYILLPQLPSVNQSPIPAETATPILSGRVEVKKYP